MLSYINAIILGPLLTVVLTTTAIFLLIKLSFKPFRTPGKSIRVFFGKNRSSSFRSVCLALSGTLGVGNIAGVASAIGVGGAGSIFWMWFFSILAMIIKYSEVVLAMRYKHHGDGGAATYIKYGLKKPIIASMFSVLIIVSSIGVGNTVQSSAAAESLKACFSVPKILTGIVFSVITLFMIYGGRKRLERFSTFVIPVLSVGYVIISLSIIFRNYKMIPYVLDMILSDAFKIQACVGGIIGFLFSKSMRVGASRGILSNEAGCGTSPFAHNTDCHPAEQGIWGIFEVFIDTIVLCTMTAFVVLMSPQSKISANGMKIALEAYGQYGSWIAVFIGISSAIYALASVVCWSYYGVSSITYLGGKRNSRRLYLTAYSFAGIIGSVFSPSLVWEISDMTVSIMTILNTLCVVGLWRDVKKSTDEYF